MDAGQGCRKKPQMILVVLPDTNPRRYAEIKRVSDTVIGIITQCVQQKRKYKYQLTFVQFIPHLTQLPFQMSSRPTSNTAPTSV